MRRLSTTVKIPEHIYIESTNYCNASCSICPNMKMHRERGTMSFDTFRIVVDQIKRIQHNNCNIYMHKEGEPLLDKHIVEKIMHIKTSLPKGNNIVLNTNASMLNDEISRKLIQSGLDTIYFSLDSIIREKYTLLREGLNFNNVISNIKHFIQLNNKEGCKVKIILQMLTDDKSSNEIDEYRSYWEPFNVEIFVKQIHNYLDVNIPGLDMLDYDNQERLCLDPFDTIVIYWNGDIGPCCWDYENIMRMGNIFSSELLEIFNNQKYMGLRKRMNTYKPNDPCSRCPRIFGGVGINGILSHEGKISRQLDYDETY